MTRLDLTVGDVFSVPIDDTRVGVGQIVAPYEGDSYYFAIFDAVAADAGSINIDQALETRILFLALSFDAKLYAGHWRIVGNRPVPDGMPMPAVKENVGLAGYAPEAS